MYPAVLLMYFISAVVILLASLALMVQDSLPYNKTGRASVLYSFNLVFVRVFLDNVEKCAAEQASDDNITPRMRYTCWIIKATNLTSKYAMLTEFFLATIVTRTCLNVAFIRTLQALLNLSSQCIIRDNQPVRIY